MVKAEEQLLLAILSPDGEGATQTICRECRLTWRRILDRALDEGIAGLLYVTLKGTSLCPEKTLSQLERVYFATWAANLTAYGAVEEIGSALQTAGLRALLLPGAALLPLYRDYGVRPMDDVDLMVDEGYVRDVISALKGLGYTPWEGYKRVFERDGVVLDLHTDLFNTDRIAARRYAVRVDPADVWMRASPSSIDGIFVMEPMDTLLYLCGHAMKHSFNTWFWFVDVQRVMMAYQEEIDWGQVVERAKQSHLLRSVCYTFLCLQRMFRISPPEAICRAIHALRFNVVERWLLQRVVRGGTIDRFGDILFLSGIERIGERIDFLRETYFPVRSVMRQVFPGIPDRLLSVAYLLRVGQVAFCGARGILRVVVGDRR
ncbi:MAG: nucleotidyltransferase family protein [Candidatus Latescibacteria bacterium]|nr:nucleotidyltransferase family protein [Candidatus Latescibacterota bacterium]